MPSDAVLSEEQINTAFAMVDPRESVMAGLRRVERATIAALAARSGVDVEALSYNIESRLYTDDGDARMTSHSSRLFDIADAIRLALATVEARHEQREAWWRELNEHTTDRHSEVVCDRCGELRKLLGLEG